MGRFGSGVAASLLVVALAGCTAAPAISPDGPREKTAEVQPPNQPISVHEASFGQLWALAYSMVYPSDLAPDVTADEMSDEIGVLAGEVESRCYPEISQADALQFDSLRATFEAQIAANLTPTQILEAARPYVDLVGSACA